VSRRSLGWNLFEPRTQCEP